MSDKISSALANAILGGGPSLTDKDYEPQDEYNLQLPHIERVTITEKELLELVVKAILDDGQISDPEQKQIRDYWAEHGQPHTRAGLTYDFFLRAGVLSNPGTGLSLSETIAKALDPGLEMAEAQPTVTITVAELAAMVAAALREGEAGKRVISPEEQKRITAALRGEGIPEGATYRLFAPTLHALDDLFKVHVWPSLAENGTTFSNAPDVYDLNMVVVYENDSEKRLAVHQALFGSPDKLRMDAYLDAQRLLFQDSDSPGSIAPEEQQMLTHPTDTDEWELGVQVYAYESAWIAATQATALSFDAAQDSRGQGEETVTYDELVGILAAANSDGNLNNRAPYIASWLAANLHALDGDARVLYQQMVQMELFTGYQRKDLATRGDDSVQTVIRKVTGRDAAVGLDDLMEIAKKVAGPTGSHFGDSAYVTLRMLARGPNPSITFTAEAEALHQTLASIGIVHDSFEATPLLAKPGQSPAKTITGVAASSTSTAGTGKGTITRAGVVKVLQLQLAEGYATNGHVGREIQASIQSWIEDNQGRFDPGARRLILLLTRMGLLSNRGQQASHEALEDVILGAVRSEKGPATVELDDLVTIVANAMSDGTFDPYDAATYVTLRQMTRYPGSPVTFSEEAEKLHQELVALGIVCDGFDKLPFVSRSAETPEASDSAPPGTGEKPDDPAADAAPQPAGDQPAP
jgi:hypothetical protein